jgi:formate dehydrogenase maturation protein FdhE
MPGRVELTERDRQILEALDVACVRQPPLADFLDFFQDLYAIQFEAKASLPPAEVREARDRRSRLERGVPQLAFDQLGIEPCSFEQVVEWIVEVFVVHDHPALQAWDKGWTAEELVALAREVFESWDTLTAPGSASGYDNGPAACGLTAQAVGFALAPYLQRAREAILPRLDLSLWTRGYCPICGGRARLALEGERQARWRLACARCDAAWNFPAETCPFCSSHELEVLFSCKKGAYRLFRCDDCQHYLKSVDLRVKPGALPMVEHLLTVGMDLVAQESGKD